VNAAPIRLVDLRKETLLSQGQPAFSVAQTNTLVPRAGIDVAIALQSVLPLIQDVATRGLDAVVEVTIARDGVDPNPVRVTQVEIDQAVAQLEPTLKKAILESSTRVRKV